jgi:hypothetical protein
MLAHSLFWWVWNRPMLLDFAISALLTLFVVVDPVSVQP